MSLSVLLRRFASESSFRFMSCLFVLYSIHAKMPKSANTVSAILIEITRYGDYTLLASCTIIDFND